MGAQILGADVVLRLISAMLLFFVFSADRGLRRWLPRLAACLGYGIALLLVHKVLIGRLNFLYYVRQVLEQGVSYQSLAFFPTSILVCAGAGLISGWLAARLLRAHSGLNTLQRNAVLVSLLLLAAGTLSAFYISFTGREHLHLNEISTGTGLISEEHGEGADYVEIHNSGFLGNSLRGCFLSDRENNLRLLALPDLVAAPGESVLILLGDDSFSLRASGGETVCLSDSSGQILDRITTVPAAYGYTYSRSTDGTGSWTLLTCTPGDSNALGWAPLEAPRYSVPEGFYDEPFLLEIHSDSELPIYYTLDGSIPTRESLRYTEPIYVYDRSPEENLYRNIPQLVTNWLDKNYDTSPVDKCFVVRAAVIDNADHSSEVVTASYFIDKAAYRDHAVVSLVSDPEGLFGEKGICVAGPAYEAWYLGGQEGKAPMGNFQQHGAAWERRAELTLFSEGSTIRQSVGIRAQGASTRANTPQKRFSIYARPMYSGSSLLEPELVPGIRSHSLMTRASVGNTLGMIFGRGLDLANEEFLQVSLFLDGELWSNASLLEKYDSQYFEQHYGIPESNLIVVKGSELSEGQPEDMAYREEINTFLETHDLSRPEDFEAFCSMVDLQSYMDFMSLNIYIDNLDFNEKKNIIWWRSRVVREGTAYEDGRWRFGLYDMDYIDWGDASYFGVERTWMKNTFILAGRTNGGPIDQQPIFSALCRNPEFRRRFVLTFQDVANICFSPEACAGAFAEYYFPFSDYYRSFFENRKDCILGFLAEEFGLTGTRQTLAVSVNDPAGGSVRINAMEIPFSPEGTWSGQYYTDYAVTLTAEPAFGYTFAGWAETGETGASITAVTEEGGIQLHAVFEPIS